MHKLHRPVLGIGLVIINLLFKTSLAAVENKCDAFYSKIDTVATFNQTTGECISVVPSIDACTLIYPSLLIGATQTATEDNNATVYHQVKGRFCNQYLDECAAQILDFDILEAGFEADITSFPDNEKPTLSEGACLLPNDLTDASQNYAAISEICNTFNAKMTALHHGISSSGKTTLDANNACSFTAWDQNDSNLVNEICDGYDFVLNARINYYTNFETTTKNKVEFVNGTCHELPITDVNTNITTTTPIQACQDINTIIEEEILLYEASSYNSENVEFVNGQCLKKSGDGDGDNSNDGNDTDDDTDNGNGNGNDKGSSMAVTCSLLVVLLSLLF